MAGPSVKLFISCVSGEFGAYRDALRHALTRPNVEVKIQEDFKPLGGDTLHVLEDYIEQCEAVVHLVGDIAGSAPAKSSVEEVRRPALRNPLLRFFTRNRSNIARETALRGRRFRGGASESRTRASRQIVRVHADRKKTILLSS